MKFTLLYFLAICSLFISCDLDTVVDLEIPPHEPVLVLNGLLNTDTIAQVVVSNSVGAFSNSRPSFINDANVLLYKEGEFIDTLLPDLLNPVYVYNYDNSGIDSIPMYYYKNNYVPEKDITYKIDVNHLDYNSISAQTYIPSDVQLYNISVDTLSNEGRIGLTFSFDDDSETQNYYSLRLFSSCTKQYEDEYGYLQAWGFSGDTEFLSNDLSFPSDIPFDGFTFRGSSVLFTDALFNGQKKIINLDVETELSYAECDTVIIKFSTFSNDTYLYYNSLGEHIDNGELGLFGGEVVPVYSNVDNGLGALISRNTQRIFLKP